MLLSQGYLARDQPRSPSRHRLVSSLLLRQSALLRYASLRPISEVNKKKKPKTSVFPHFSCGGFIAMPALGDFHSLPQERLPEGGRCPLWFNHQCRLSGGGWFAGGGVLSEHRSLRGAITAQDTRLRLCEVGETPPEPELPPRRAEPQLWPPPSAFPPRGARQGSSAQA